VRLCCRTAHWLDDDAGCAARLAIMADAVNAGREVPVKMFINGEWETFLFIKKAPKDPIEIKCYVRDSNECNPNNGITDNREPRNNCI